MITRFKLRTERLRQNTFAVLDIGSSKVTMLIGETVGNKVNILGVGTAASEGMQRGMVVNISKSVEAIDKCRKDAQQMSGQTISEMVVSVGGSHIGSVEKVGITSIRGTEVSPRDLQDVLNSAVHFQIPVDARIVGVLPREYTVDDQSGIKDPVGIAGVRLEASVEVLLAYATAVENIENCVRRSNLKVRELVATPAASGLAVLDPNELELGTAVVDIGAGATSVSIWKERRLQNAFVLPFGGDSLTQDIAKGLRTPPDSAEELKTKAGCAHSDLVADGETITVPGIGNRPDKIVSRQILPELIEPRLEEILNEIAKALRERSFNIDYAGGIVLTGGTAALPGIMEVAHKILDIPVRIGTPIGVTGLSSIVDSPQYATAVGLAKFVAYQKVMDEPRSMWPLTEVKKQGWLASLYARAAGFLG